MGILEQLGCAAAELQKLALPDLLRQLPSLSRLHEARADHLQDPGTWASSSAKTRTLPWLQILRRFLEMRDEGGELTKGVEDTRVRCVAGGVMATPGSTHELQPSLANSYLTEPVALLASCYLQDPQAQCAGFPSLHPPPSIFPTLPSFFPYSS